MVRGVDAVAGPGVGQEAAERHLHAEGQLLVGRLGAVRIVAVADAIDIAVPAGAEGALVAVLVPVILLVTGDKERAVAAEALAEVELEFLPLVVLHPPAVIAVRPQVIGLLEGVKAFGGVAVRRQGEAGVGGLEIL